MAGYYIPGAMGLLNVIGGDGQESGDPSAPVSSSPTSAAVKKKDIPPFKFQMPDWDNFALQTGFGYANPMDQLKDAFRLPTQGGGVFMGNTAPRYGQPAPNMTFPTAFQGLLSQFIGGGKKAQPFQRPGARSLLGK